MLLLSEKLFGVPIMGLQTGNKLAQTVGIIIDPKDLHIVAFYVDGEGVDIKPSVLHSQDIREMGELGFIIDDSTKIMPLDGLVRLQAIIDEGFTLIDCAVIDKSNNKLGKVEDYSFEPESLVIQQLFIKRPFLQSIAQTSNIIHRKQILAIYPDKIIVDSPTIKEKITSKAEEATSFVNPFRAADPETRS